MCTHDDLHFAVAAVRLPGARRRAVRAACLGSPEIASSRVAPQPAVHGATAGRTPGRSLAYQHFEERSKGSLEVGKLADFAVLDGNPLTIDPMKIPDIKVVETIKEGKTVYRRDLATKKVGAGASCAESAACYQVAAHALGRAGVIHAHDHED